MFNLEALYHEESYNIEEGLENVPDKLSLYCQDTDELHSSALNNLAFILQEVHSDLNKDTLEAVILYERAIDAGNLCAMVNLAFLYEEGLNNITIGIPRNASTHFDSFDVYIQTHATSGSQIFNHEDIELYERAFSMGRTGAMFNLANIYVA